MSIFDEEIREQDKAKSTREQRKEEEIRKGEKIRMNLYRAIHPYCVEAINALYDNNVSKKNDPISLSRFGSIFGSKIGWKIFSGLFYGICNRRCPVRI